MTETPPSISPKALSDALAALDTYAEAPTNAQLAPAELAELAEGRVVLVARLSNALYGSALAHVMTTEVTVAQAGSHGGCRGEAWRAAGADGGRRWQKTRSAWMLARAGFAW